ncbi:hypothetical protein P9D54_03070 [Bacillus haynesii]|nr:hypothetical protein [Bacillus haynesii]MEC1344353.1 hypothetical protein [Bacillus haynesii]
MNRFTIFFGHFYKTPIFYKESNLGLAVLMSFADALAVEKDDRQ